MNVKTSIWDRNDRLAGLRRFAVAITVLNIAGHFFLGFEQSWAQPLAALAAAYGMEILMELVDARLNKRAYRFKGGVRSWVDFLLSAHISGLACSMLLYSNQRLWPTAFAAAMAIASKGIVRIKMKGGERHVLNPSNFGITITLLLFPWVGVAQPYMFTENLGGTADWVFPVVAIMLGFFLNANFTKRVPLILAWLGGFVIQALIRTEIVGTPTMAALAPVTGIAFLLFTFYMVTDPATTPSSKWGQIAFGAGTAALYSVLVASHIVFGMFFALTIVCLIRLISLLVLGLYTKEKQPEAPAMPAPAARPVREPMVLVQEEA